MKTLLLALLFVSPASAQNSDDSDIAGRPAAGQKDRLQAEGWFRRGLAVFPLKSLPSAATLEAKPGRASGTLLLAAFDGSLKPGRLAKVSLLGPEDKVVSTDETADDGSFALALPAAVSGRFHVRVALDNKLWTFDNDKGDGYAFDGPAFDLPAPAGIALGAVGPEPGSENAKVAWIHLTFLEARDAMLRQRVGTDWWTKTLSVNWPEDSDYFSSWGFSLHLSRAEAWDVVLHELGHAVMHLSMRAASAGGSHKIDECYSPALAWSEGWATFFAASVRLDPADPDAKFEYLVPRRAPIRLERVPEDVCRGQANEWRVAAALWDLYDSNPDGSDTGSLPFARLWSAWGGKSMGSLTDYLGLLSPALSPAELAAALGGLKESGIEPKAGTFRLNAAVPTLSAPEF
ncbi:MAG: hypothetical protein HY925_10410 [Elusimicrobia bacterium]|nr:hypothetical protein [Elusimicrobiota bacterium]